MIFMAISISIIIFFIFNESINNNQMDKQVKIAFFIITSLRLLQIFSDYNYDWPDQYWQGPQIAYKLANGYGFKTWQWTIEHPIRNIIYQAYLSIGYRMGNFLNLEPINKERMVKIMQVFIAILCDWFLIKIALVYTRKTSFITTILLLSNWFYFSMMNRTYINSIQTCLTVIAYYFWIVRDRGLKYDLLSRIIVGFNFVIRTTSIILWVVIWPFQLLTMKANRVKFIIKNILQILLMLMFSIGFNSYWYQNFTFVESNFFKYNILMKWSELYGVTSYMHYFYYVIPFILGGYILPFLISLVTIFKKKVEGYQKNKKDIDDAKQQLIQEAQNPRYRTLLIILLLTLIILSFSAHKQPRFLLLLTPFLLILSLKGLKKLQNNRLSIFFIILINISIFFIAAFYGKNGGAKLLRTLRQDINQNYSNRLQDIAVIYLCEPHSLPAFSVIQQDITLKLLDTSPLRKLQNFNEQIELRQKPLTLYNKLTQQIGQKSIFYVIVQDKYSVFNGHFSEKYQFLLQYKYSLLKSQRNSNLWQQFWDKYDRFILLKKG